jgi:hypothetical protein
MASQECIIDIEGQRGFFQILLYLNDNSEMCQSQLYNNRPHISISNNATATRALALLVKYKLIMENKKDGSNAIYYQLTEKGRDCARLLIEFQQLLEKE